MNSALIAIVSILAYLSSAGLVGWRLFNHVDSSEARLRRITLALGFVGLAMHTWLLYRGIFSHAGLNLAFFNALSLTAWTVVASLLISSLSKPIENLGLVILPLASVAVFLDLLYPSVSFMSEDASWVLKLHVLLSMLAYSLLTLASVQALLLAVQDHYLRKRRPGGFIRALPPLMTMEALLFEMIGIGFVLLTLALLILAYFGSKLVLELILHRSP